MRVPCYAAEFPPLRTDEPADRRICQLKLWPDGGTPHRPEVPKKENVIC